MKTETIRKIAIEEGLQEDKINLFVEFFNSRFPHESDNIRYYCAEWVNRFKSNPVRYMDEESEQIYLKVVNK